MTPIARRRHGPSLSLAVLALALLQAHAALAQDAWIDAPLTLQRTPLIPETIPQAERGERPSLVDGDRISGRPNLETVVEGNASLRRGDGIGGGHGGGPCDGGAAGGRGRGCGHG